MGDTQVRKFGFAVEATAGTPVAATTFMPGTLTLDPTIDYYEGEGYRGTYGGPHETVQGAKIVAAQLNADLRQKELGMFLDAIICKVTPSTVDTTGKVRTYTDLSADAGAARTINTIEEVDVDNAFYATWVIWKMLTIGFSETQKASLSVQGFAQDYQSLGSAASYVNSIQDPLMSWNRQLAIDAAGATPGTTVVSNRFVSGQFSLDNQAKPSYPGSYTQLYKKIGYGQFKPAFNCRALMSADAYQYAQFLAGTPQVIQASLRGPLISAVYQGVVINMCGKWKTWKKVGNYNNLNAVDMVWEPSYDATLGYTWSIICTNLVANNGY